MWIRLHLLWKRCTSENLSSEGRLKPRRSGWECNSPETCNKIEWMVDDVLGALIEGYYSGSGITSIYFGVD